MRMAEDIKKEETLDAEETADAQNQESLNEETQDAESREADAASEDEAGKAADDGAPAEKEQQEAEPTDQLKRQMAEFDNYRKRTEKEKASMYVIGAKEIVEKILPIVDNFERGLASVPDEQKEDPFVDGMDKIYRQLMTALEEMGVKVIEAVGQEFNPDLHNAVMHVEDEDAGENIIVEEFQKGYLYKDFVVRHSMVKVAN